MCIRDRDLIAFLSKIYDDNRFENLKEVKIRKANYYFILRDEDERFYIREDYLSSGEYFVINLFRHIQSGKKIIYIDEIDISLDSTAQVNLLEALREICTEQDIFIVFSTHSLALMKTVKLKSFFTSKGMRQPMRYLLKIVLITSLKVYCTDLQDMTSIY